MKLLIVTSLITLASCDDYPSRYIVQQPTGAEVPEKLAPYEAEAGGKLLSCYHIKIMSTEAVWYTEMAVLGVGGAYVGNTISGGEAEACGDRVWFYTKDTGKTKSFPLKIGLRRPRRQRLR
jgi:hypothetical protein